MDGPDRQEALTPGRIIGGQFRVCRRLGAGGMGVVYLAEQIGVERPVVVKVMRRDLSGDPDTLHRFHREARAVGRLNHPNIVQVYTMGQEGGELFMAMEYVDGYPLSDLREQRRPLPEGRVLRIAAQILAALEVAHGEGVIHRDLKPENVMLLDRPAFPDLVKVLDFGLARLLGDSAAGITRTGDISGTPRYMSPEQALGEPLTHQTDLYSLGIILYELFAGRPPWEVSSPVEYLRLHGYEPIPPLEAAAPAGLDPRTIALVRRCLEKDPADRYPDAASALDDLRPLLVDLPAAPPGPRPAQRGATARTPAPDADAATLAASSSPGPARSPAARPRPRLPRRAALVLLALAAVLVVASISLRPFVRIRSSAPSAADSAVADVDVVVDAPGADSGGDSEAVAVAVADSVVTADSTAVAADTGASGVSSSADGARTPETVTVDAPLFSGSPATAERREAIAFKGIPRPPDAALVTRQPEVLTFYTREDPAALKARFRDWLLEVGAEVPPDITGAWNADELSPLRNLAIQGNPMDPAMSLVTLSLNPARNWSFPVMTRGLFGEWLPGECQVTWLAPQAAGYFCPGDAEEIAAAYGALTADLPGLRAQRQVSAAGLLWAATAPGPGGGSFSVNVAAMGTPGVVWVAFSRDPTAEGLVVTPP